MSGSRHDNTNQIYTAIAPADGVELLLLALGSWLLLLLVARPSPRAVFGGEVGTLELARFVALVGEVAPSIGTSC